MRTAFALCALALALHATPDPPEPPHRWLVLPEADARGRRPFNPDAVFARHLLDPAAPAPVEGGAIMGSNGNEVRWSPLDAGAEGVRGNYSYAYATLRCESESLVLARLPGGATLFVNGEAFAGDIYGSGHGGVPVVLREGVNHLFVRGMRGGFRLEFLEIEPGLRVLTQDATLPDFITAASPPKPAAAVVVNASRKAQAGFAPLGLRKVAGEIDAPGPPDTACAWRSPVATGSFVVQRRSAAEVRRVTFVSAIDGSVQEYSVRPPAGAADAMVLTLHGAGVDARNQAASYSPKNDFWIVAPTNRRPFGFDWQDWGRRDGYEALADALALTGVDAGRVYLTGHSMGGHGTWHFAANDPDRFLAIAPSAGWSSFDSYGGRPGGVRDALWRGADGASLTMNLISNLRQVPTYILHGDADDNVPVSEAQAMLAALPGTAHHFQPGAGHWWDGDASPGADCVDWPALFDFFRSRGPRPAADRVSFVSADPSVDSRHHWIELLQPLRHGEPCGIDAARDGDHITVTTSNLRAFRGPGGRYTVDREEVGAVSEGSLLRDGEHWRAGTPAASEKSPARSGPFKRAFDRRFVLVYGAADEESMRRARYDAQIWWYRGNGDAPMVSDEEFLAGDFAGRNVILYGNATSNRAWESVLPAECPVRIEAGSIRCGQERYLGVGLGALFVYPRKGEAETLVGVVGHTGLPGARLGYGLLYFISGVGYPDYCLFGEQILAEGDAGVLKAGWFAHSWELDQ